MHPQTLECFETSTARSDLPDAVRQVLPRLRDPEFTKILLITLPEATPVHEAALLQKDLGRAGISPFGWVINQSLTPLQVSDPVLWAKRESESSYIHEVVETTCGERCPAALDEGSFEPARVAAHANERCAS